MNTVELVRSIIGGFLIIYGLFFSALEKFHGIKYVDQINGIINGFVCIIAGIVVSAYTIQRGVWVGIVGLSLWGIEQLIIRKIKKQKNS